ncbi:MAG: hypothetical protein COA50_07820 [Flavobacteriaceae bacterium]|nr:MAG: hypothetical protein COA50_07820 [Flavobacteriaceae bacterium]
MIYTKYLCLLFLVSACSTVPSGKEILKKSIAFHDPNGQWNNLQQKIIIQSDFVYPDSTFYSLSIGLDNPNKRVSYTNTSLAQRVDFTDTTCLVVMGDITCDQAAWTKNFYHFIHGLPMTLQNDEGVINESIVQTTFHNIPCHRVAVDFVKEKWHFYFSKADHRLVGFTFNKNFESKAEEILTDGLIEINSMKLCKSRFWWITTDSLAPIYSGKDVIKSSSLWVKND